MRIPRSAIALFCTALQVCFGTVYAWSFFQTILVHQGGWTHTETAWAFSIAIFSLGVSAAWAGNMLSRLGPRFLAVAGSIMFSGGYLISGAALHLDSIPLFYLGYGVIGGAGIGLGYVTPVATVAKWFPDRKGLATGIVVMGFGVGAFLLSKGLAPFLIVRTAGTLPLVFIWLGIVFACILIPCSLALSDPPASASPAAAADESPGFGEPESAITYLRTTQFVIMWDRLLLQYRRRNLGDQLPVGDPSGDLGLADNTIEPTTLAEYGATLIAVSSICNGLGRLFWGLLSDRFGRVTVFRVLLVSQMVVFGILMTETNPWVFSALVCYVLLCFGGGFATMPPFVLDVFGTRKMSTIYGAVLTAWAAAGISGPLYVGYLKDVYPDRAVMYCFLIGILMLGAGYLFSYLLNDGRIRLGRPTLESTLHRYGIPVPGKG